MANLPTLPYNVSLSNKISLRCKNARGFNVGAAVKKNMRGRNPPAPARVAARRRGGAAVRRNGKLSRELVAQTAMALVDRDGLEGLSFRKLGAGLGCEAMSIYHHFPSKAHLIDALIDLMLSEVEIQSQA